MKGEVLLERLSRPENSPVFAALYGEEETGNARNRYAGLVEGLIEGFPGAGGEVRMFTAAGRTELGGNHTDHNRGKVLAASIQLDAVAAVSPREDNKVFFRSVGFPDVEVDLPGPGDETAAPRENERGSTEALVRGIAAEFAARGTAVRGFTANAASTVLPGSGLSSSAAVEILLGSVFNHLYGGGRFTPLELAVIGQRAENNYFGKPSGLMDQTACASGGAVAIDFEDPRSPLVRPLAFNPAALGYRLCVVDTRGSHVDLTPEYTAIPGEMGAAARFFGKTALREITRADVLAHAGELRKAAGDRAILRALHFFNENRRVDDMTAALEKAGTPGGEGAFQDFLRLVNESGASSWQLLQNVYAPANPGEQGISLALALTGEFFDALGEGGRMPGACRVHGGGFAGTIQVYLREDCFDAYGELADGVFGKGALTALRIRPTGTGELFF